MMLLPIAASILAIVFAVFLTLNVLKKDEGTPKMIEISNAIKEGAMAYLKRQYTVIAVFAIILTAVLWFAINPYTAIGFALGAICSALAGFIGMNVSVRSNLRTAAAAKKGLSEAMNVAVRGGAVTGFVVVGLALLGVSLLYMLFNDIKLIIGFGFGASLISLFARVGGGIYTKAADVGADLVGKVEAGIPEDDPRNPAVIADNVGDNVGDCAGMAADIFETYVVTAIAAMLLGALTFSGTAAIMYPLMLGAVALFASMVGIAMVRIGNTKKVAGKAIMGALYKGLFTSAILAAILFYFVTGWMGFGMNMYYVTLVGLAITILINIITEYWTSTEFKPVRMIAEASQTGPGTNVITGLAIGLKSTLFPMLLVIAGIFAAYTLAGVYGIAIATMSMLSLAAIIVTIDSYGPITDNAGGIAEMANLPSGVRKITDALDAVGNTTKAVTKGFAIGSAALAALALFAAFNQEVNIARAAAGMTGDFALLITDPLVLIGLFIGGVIPFVFSAYCMQAVGKAAFSIVSEVRRQFKTMPGIMKGTTKPDYAKCVDIVTAAAQKELIIPGLLSIIPPLAVGFLLGPKALGGMLIGSIVTGFLLAVQMTTGGAAWDNAKKYIESGKYGGKGSYAHKAAVVGDTVGDPFKDTAGPALNPLIKVMNIVALLFITLIVTYSVIP